MLDLTGLVAHYAKLWHGGRIPFDRASFIEMILRDYMPEHCRAISPFSPAEWDRERAMTADALETACDLLSRPIMGWRN